MTNPVDDDPLNNEESSLVVPAIRISPMELEIEEPFEPRWGTIAKWVNTRVPKVLVYKDQQNHEWVINFQTSELYLEFVNAFPFVLKGTDEPT